MAKGDSSAVGIVAILVILLLAILAVVAVRYDFFPFERNVVIEDQGDVDIIQQPAPQERVVERTTVIEDDDPDTVVVRDDEPDTTNVNLDTTGDGSGGDGTQPAQ
jgi:hypothetical protein